MLKPKIHQHLLECGTDEAGRGCLAGPVTAAAVILPDNFRHPLLNDSKKLSAKQRERLRPLIEKHAITYSVVHVAVEEIDRLNILNASIEAMHRAIGGLDINPGFIAVDGNRFKPFGDVPFECIVKGDGKYLHIAAASVLAKTHRDELLGKLHVDYPKYGWDQNKGYPTAQHRKALQEFGTTPHHRRSFRLFPGQLELPLN